MTLLSQRPQRRQRQETWSNRSLRGRARTRRRYECLRECLRCGELGHWAVTCTKKVRKNKRFGFDACLRYHEQGHWAKDCPRNYIEKNKLAVHQASLICSMWNRDTRSCNGGCNKLHICCNVKCKKLTDRYPATHLQGLRGPTGALQHWKAQRSVLNLHADDGRWHSTH